MKERKVHIVNSMKRYVKKLPENVSPNKLNWH